MLNRLIFLITLYSLFFYTAGHGSCMSRDGKSAMSKTCTRIARNLKNNYEFYCSCCNADNSFCCISDKACCGLTCLLCGLALVSSTIVAENNNHAHEQMIRDFKSPAGNPRDCANFQNWWLHNRNVELDGYHENGFGLLVNQENPCLERIPNYLAMKYQASTIRRRIFGSKNKGTITVTTSAHSSRPERKQKSSKQKQS